MPTCVIGILGEDIPGPALMFRASMDALAVEEETGLSYTSCIPGVMHACGHDAHMASLLGAAKVLSRHKSEFESIGLSFSSSLPQKAGRSENTYRKHVSGKVRYRLLYMSKLAF